MTVVHWNGHDTPEELKGLPPGRYVLQPIDGLVELDQDEESRLREAMEQAERGEGTEHADVMRRARAALQP